MSEHEFDNYLALLSRLLRLGDKQRDAIAGELRAHLEDRLEDLMSRGVPRDEAVRQALEEFGDAAVLAADFASLSGTKRKRWIMRLTTASAAAIVLIAAGIFTFWPGGNAGPGAAMLVAQAPAAADPNTETKPTQKREVVDVKEALEQRMTFEFDERPLSEAMKQIGERTGMLIHIDAMKLEEAGVSPDTPIKIGFPNIRLRTFLDLMLGELELTYVSKDDVLVITTPEDAEDPDSMIIRVYDCRELFELARPVGSIRPKIQRGGGGFFAVQDQPARKTPAENEAGTTAPAAEGGAPAATVGPPGVARPGATGGGSGGGGFGGFTGGGTVEEISDAQNLIDVITTIVDAESWVDVGGPGAIAEYKGLLSVAATQETHDKVERLLNMFHQAANLKSLKITVVE
jgi:hypothetical protein